MISSGYEVHYPKASWLKGKHSPKMEPEKRYYHSKSFCPHYSNPWGPMGKRCGSETSLGTSRALSLGTYLLSNSQKTWRGERNRGSHFELRLLQVYRCVTYRERGNTYTSLLTARFTELSKEEATYSTNM